MPALTLGKIPAAAIRKAVLESPRFKAALSRASKAIRKQMKSAFLRGFRRTLFYKGLLYRGPTEDSVSAQLGFGGEGETSAGSAIRLIETLFNQLVSNTENKIRRRGREIFLDVNTGDIEEAMANESRGSYKSVNAKGKRSTVPWLKWAIEGGGVTGYGIHFLTAGEANRKYKKASRSGYAVMVKPTFGKQKAAGLSWSIDDYDRFAETENFVQDIFNDEAFQKDVNDILVGAITRELKNV